MVANNAMAPKAANAIVYAANSILTAIRVDDHARKMDELEQTIEQLRVQQRVDAERSRRGA